MFDTKNKKAKVTPETKEEARQLRAIWDKTEHPSQAVFGEIYGIGGQSAVGQFLRGDVPLSVKAAKGFAEGLGCAVDEFSPRLAREIQDSVLRGLAVMRQPNGPAKTQVAQDLTLDIHTVDALTWERLMSTSTLPATFGVLMPDAALEPKIKEGMLLKFRATSERPKPGSGVLVQDSEGRRYIRRAVELNDGTWAAQARHDAYRSLHSVNDGLTVLAVMTGYYVMDEEA